MDRQIFRPIKQEKLSVKISNQIKTLIIEGELKPGDLLPTERELMQLLNVSRPSIREALKALQWMVAQMELRYRQLARWSVRNIQQYNEKIGRGEILDEDGQPVTEVMPYYITIVDELADLMLQLGGDMEGPITRLAQKARAVGVHLILATQRPSVDVLTGVIKANIPCRIAFRVIQKNDSRTILDMNGAEQLLGHGDMLYLQPGRALPVRVHGSFIDMDECDAIAGYWRQYAGQTEEISLNEHPAGGGMVTVVINGAKQVQQITIDPEVVSKDDVEMLQDLILAAINDAHRKADEAMAQQMGGMLGGLKIPGLNG